MNKNLILSGQEFKRIDKSYDNACKNHDILVIFQNDTGVITKMDDLEQPIIPKHLIKDINRIENFHEKSIYSIAKQSLNNERLRMLKENTRISHISEYSKKI